MKIINNISPLFDNSGNFYLEVNNKVFEFSIDNKNNLELYEIFNTDNFNYVVHDESSSNYKKKHLELLSNSTTLKSKVIREYIKEKEENPDAEYDTDEDIDTNMMNEINHNLQYYPEDLEVLEQDNTEENQNEDNEIGFNFFGNINLKKLEEVDMKDNYFKENTLELSTYDTFVYNGDMEHSELVFVSKLNSYNSPYRLLIYKDGSIEFKIIGSMKKCYKLKYDESLVTIHLDRI